MTFASIMSLRTFAVAVVCCVAFETAVAAHIEPLKTKLSSVAGSAPVLLIETPSGKKRLALGDLERLPMKQSTLRTNFGMNGTFQGVMLSDLLAAYGLESTGDITLVAADGYAIFLRRSDLQASPALLATRFNGKVIDDPAKGPLILVWPELEQAALSSEDLSSQWIWSVIKIRPDHESPVLMLVNQMAGRTVAHLLRGLGLAVGYFCLAWRRKHRGNA